MKKIFLLLLFSMVIFPFFSLETEDFASSQFDLDKLLSSVKNPEAPYVEGNYVVFTANSSARYVGVAFDFDQYGVVYPFRRLVRGGFLGSSEESVLFYILEIPPAVQDISYRLVIDGLWTTDPENPIEIYDPALNLMVSVIPIDRIMEMVTITGYTNQETVRFVYEGESGQRIRLGGSFSNWDSFIYELVETSPGLYQLDLALPKGTHYYSFYRGITSFEDNENPSRVYTPDGRVVSVITVN